MKDIIIKNKFYPDAKPYAVLVGVEYYKKKYPDATVTFEFIKNTTKKEKYGKIYNFHIIFENKYNLRCQPDEGRGIYC